MDQDAQEQGRPAPPPPPSPPSSVYDSDDDCSASSHSVSSRESGQNRNYSTTRVYQKRQPVRRRNQIWSTEEKEYLQVCLDATSSTMEAAERLVKRYPYRRVQQVYNYGWRFRSELASKDGSVERRPTVHWSSKEDARLARLLAEEDLPIASSHVCRRYAELYSDRTPDSVYQRYRNHKEMFHHAVRLLKTQEENRRNRSPSSSLSSSSSSSVQISSLPPSLDPPQLPTPNTKQIILSLNIPSSKRRVAEQDIESSSKSRRTEDPVAFEKSLSHPHFLTHEPSVPRPSPTSRSLSPSPTSVPFQLALPRLQPSQPPSPVASGSSSNAFPRHLGRSHTSSPSRSVSPDALNHSDSDSSSSSSSSSEDDDHEPEFLNLEPSSSSLNLQSPSASHSHPSQKTSSCHFCGDTHSSFYQTLELAGPRPSNPNALVLLPDQLACSSCVNFVGKILMGGGKGVLVGVSELEMLAWVGKKLVERGKEERRARVE